MKLNKENAKIAGVCAGLSDYFGIDTTIVRLIFLCSVLFFGISPLIYIILWLVMSMKN